MKGGARAFRGAAPHAPIHPDPQGMKREGLSPSPYKPGIRRGQPD